jgi:hypothetical protein
MGPDTKTAMVGGHIFVYEAYEPEAGRIVLRQMDNPISQRTIVADSKQPVAEEFWITKGAWDVDSAGR